MRDADPATGAGHEWGTAPDFVGPRHELRERLLLDLLIQGGPGRRVLNVGAGQGSFTHLLSARGFDVVSADVSPTAVEVLRRRVGSQVLQADMASLPFSDSSFDVVVAGEVLEHISNEGDALLEAARVLRPGGLLAVSVPAHPEWFGASDRWAGHVRRYTSDTLARAIEDAGFELESVRPWGFPMSALYHRLLYDKRAAELAADPKPRRVSLFVLRVMLQVDRLFVGVERGCLGYLARARVPKG